MSSFSFTFDSPTNPWVITHGLNDEHVFWVLYDDAGEFILPTSAVATSADLFTFTFDTAITGSGRILSVLDLVSFASAASFTDLTTVKQCLGLDANDSSQDELIARLIAGVSENMKSYLRREIVETTHVGEIHSGKGKSDLLLNEFPVVAASGITITQDSQEIDSGSFVIDTDASIVHLKDGLTFNTGVGNLSVDHVSGFTDGVPQDLNLATVKQVLYELPLKGDRNAISLARSKIDGVLEDVYLTDEWAQGVQGVLDRYRRRSL
jgi:hypothetical protein